MLDIDIERLGRAKILTKLRKKFYEQSSVVKVHECKCLFEVQYHKSYNYHFPTALFLS